MAQPDLELPRGEIDLHCHILPAWDDGPRSLESSLNMARDAVKNGVKQIVATPHIGRAFNGEEKPAQEIAEAVARLQDELDAAQIDLKIIPGGEILLGSVDIAERVNKESYLTIGGMGKYVLVESPFRAWPDWGDSLLFQLGLRGVTPIIAHPERYSNVCESVKTMEKAVSGGALLQITAETLLGEQGREMKKCCQQLLNAGMVSLVASDSHRAGTSWPGAAAQTLIEQVGERAAKTILEENPRRILAGKMAAVPEIEKPRETSGGWKRWFKGRNP